MSAQKKSDKQVNLLPKDPFLSSTKGRVLKWALTSFRLMVIVVEFVVMSAFISRFWLDSISNDLNDSLKQKQAIIDSYSDFEKEFKGLQNKLFIFDQIKKTSKVPSIYLKKVSSYLPDNVFLTTIIMGDKSVTVSGVTSSELAVAQFMANLSSDKDFPDVVLAGISTNQQDKSLMNFRIDIAQGGQNK